MSQLVNRTWTRPRGQSVVYRAFVPAPLATRDLDLKERTLNEVEGAAAALSATTASSVHWEPLARLILRSEGVASSSIEHVEVPTQDLVVASLGTPTGPTSWILGNIEVIRRAAAGQRSISWDDICQWHSTLMVGTRLDPRHIGAQRDVQNWIGGHDPSWAVFVPPPPELLTELIEDLVGFANRTDLPTVVQAAVIHGQFETIHPFADGNGRVGRALIVWCLARRGLSVGVVPPISPIIAGDTDAYIAGLYDFREGSLDRWVAWFADVCQRSASLLGGVGARLEQVSDEWKARLSDLRSDAAAHRVLELLAGAGAVDVATVVRQLDVSGQTARTAMAVLEQRNIVERATVPTGQPGRPPVAWVAPDIVEIVSQASLRARSF